MNFFYTVLETKQLELLLQAGLALSAIVAAEGEMQPSLAGENACCRSDEDRSAIDHESLPSSESFPHQKQVGLRYVMRLADPADRQTLADALKKAVPFCCAHVLPEVCPNDSRRDCIHTNRRQLERKRARQGLDCSANTSGNNPSFMRALPCDSGSERDRTTRTNTLACVFDRS